MAHDHHATACYDPLDLPDVYTRLTPSFATPAALSGDIQVDAVVIGAGITGCSTAWHLAKAGKSVAQLEAGDISSGGSGRAFGLVVPYGKHSEKKILAHLGEEQGQRHIDCLAEGPSLVKTFIERHSMAGANTGEGWALAPHIPSASAGLQARATYWQSRGADVQFLSGDDARAVTGSRRYADILLDNRALTINPLAYTRGLARAVREAGASQFAHSPATVILPRGDAWIVTTPQGRVTADMVFICTNAYTGNLWPKLRRTLVRIRGHQATTAPVSDNILGQILPGASAITDTRHTWSGLKKLPDGRLHLSAGGPAISGNSRADIKSVRDRLKELYPDLPDIQWDNDWSGWVAMTRDQFPMIQRLGNGVWAGSGYNGRGLAAATIMGRELAELACGSNYRPFVPVRDVRPLPFHMLGKFAVATIIQYYRALDRRDLGRHVRSEGSNGPV